MEGTYRIHGGEQELLESFVAAPGPAGWRYFGRVLAPEGRELFTIDFVVDNDWRLVRYRERHVTGDEAVVVPADGGMEVIWLGSGADSSRVFKGADIVWSRSPCSLLIADRRSRVLGATGFQAVRIHAPDLAVLLPVSLSQIGEQSVKLGSGSSTARKLLVHAGDVTFTALVRNDAPLAAEGWFDLIA